MTPVEEGTLAEERRPAFDDAPADVLRPFDVRGTSPAGRRSSPPRSPRRTPTSAPRRDHRRALVRRRRSRWLGRLRGEDELWRSGRAIPGDRGSPQALRVDGSREDARAGRRILAEPAALRRSSRARLAPLPPARRRRRSARRRTRRRPQSSMIATARTGAAVVPIHLIGKTESLKPCVGSWSRFMRFSRCQ